MTLNKLIYTPSFCMPGFIYMFFAVSLEILRNEYTVVKQVFWTFYIYLIGHVPKLMISVFLFFMLLGKESFFFFFFFFLDSWNEVIPNFILFSFILLERCIWYTCRQTQTRTHLNTRSIFSRLPRKDIYMFIVMQWW